MLAELAAINAAYAVIKSFVSNGRELSECGAQIGSFFNNKTKLEKRVRSAPAEKRNTLEEFFALEQVRLKERELKDLMLIAGRPGLWDDWCRFQSQVARQEIDDAIKSAKVLKKKQDDKEELTLIMMTVFLMLLAVSVIVGLIYIISLR
jgi:hypothetical protein